jgi:hypothetical protein
MVLMCTLLRRNGPCHIHALPLVPLYIPRVHLSCGDAFWRLAPGLIGPHVCGSSAPGLQVLWSSCVTLPVTLMYRREGRVPCGEETFDAAM